MKIPLRWSITGAVIGAMGFVYNLIASGRSSMGLMSVVGG